MSAERMALTQAEYDAKLADAKARAASGDMDGMVGAMNLEIALERGIIVIVRDDR